MHEFLVRRNNRKVSQKASIDKRFIKALDVYNSATI